MYLIIYLIDNLNLRYTFETFCTNLQLATMVFSKSILKK